MKCTEKADLYINRLVIAWGQEWKQINCKGVGGSYWNDGNVLKQYGSLGCAKMINLLEIIELHT